MSRTPTSSALATCVNQTGAALRTCLNDTTDVPQMINEFASMVVVWQTDQREFNFIVYRDNTQNRLWRMLPDDLDRTWGNHSGGNNPVNLDPSSGKPYRRCIGTDPTPANEICRAFMRVPEFKEMYLRRIRTLTDEVLADPKWQNQLDDAEALLGDEWADDEARWNRTPHSLSQMLSAMDQWIDDYVAHLRAGGHENNIPGQQSAAPVVTISDYRSDPGDGLGYVLITNPSASESVDLSNWTFDGLAEIPVGLVVLPGATVAVSTNDQAFRAMNPSFTGVRATTNGTLAGQITPVAPQWLDCRNGWRCARHRRSSSTSGTQSRRRTRSPEAMRPLASIAGNGGDWFELVVVEDGLDVRGWRLGHVGQMTDRARQCGMNSSFADDPLLASLEGGTIITVSEDLADDVQFLPAFGDWHINLQANSADTGQYFTAASQSNFSTNHDNWQLSIFDDAGTLVFGPAGEGIGATSGVNSSEIGELQVAAVDCTLTR